MAEPENLERAKVLSPRSTRGRSTGGRTRCGRVSSRAAVVLAILLAPIGPAATAATTVATGPDHALAVTVEGDVWAWGDDTRGQLGTGVGRPSPEPIRVRALDGIAAVAAGRDFSVALGVDGTVWTWGANDLGQLGDGTKIDRAAPGSVSGLPGMVAVSAAADHVVALAEDRTVWAWGAGRLHPDVVGGLPAVRSVAAAAGTAYAISMDGTLWTWSTDDPAPKPIQNLDAVSDIAIGSEGAILAVTRGRVIGGQPARDEWRVVFKAGAVPNPVRSVALSGDTALAVGLDGTVWTIPEILSTGRRTAASPTAVPQIADIVAVAAGRDRALALQRGGALWTWSRDAETIERIAMPEVMWRTEAPELRPPDGDYAWPRYVSASSDTPNAEVRITRDGRTPTLDDPILARDDAVLVERDTELRARAWADDLDPSPVAVARYTIDQTRPGSSRRSADEAPLLRERGTKDGTDLISQNGFETGDLAGWSAFQPPPTTPIGAPILTPGGGVFAAPQIVTVTCPIPGAVVRFTVSGVAPSESDPIVPCGGTIAVNGSTTVRARAWAVGFLPSAVAAATFHLDLGNVDAPSFDPPGGAYSGPQSVSISTTTPGATIRYTTDGTLPDFNSPIATGPVEITATAVIEARAFLKDFAPSAPASATYVIGEAGTTGAPLLSPGGGTYPAGFQVTVSNTTPGATIRYTIDGTIPDETADIIDDGGTITVEQPLRIVARAWADGLEPSPLTIGDYNIVGAVAAGAHHSLALRDDGTVWAWGLNGEGQLGLGDTDKRLTPVQIPGLTNVAAIEAGQRHSFALLNDGTVRAWGNGGYGRLGTGDHVNRLVPTQIMVDDSGTPLDGIVAITGGGGHSMALASDGTVWAWGTNLSGQLGLGTTENYRLRPVKVPNLSGVSAIAAGGSHSLVLKTDGEAFGSLWVFGENGDGQLGDGTNEDRRNPIMVLDGVRAICAGGVHTLALMADGTVRAVGLNTYGNLGIGVVGDSVADWQAVSLGGSQVVRMVAGGVHSELLTADRTLLGTGDNSLGQIGDGTTIRRTSPISVVLLHDVVDVAASMFIKTPFIVMGGHSLAVTPDGRVWVWGSNAYGQLGIDGTNHDNRYRPFPLPGFDLTDRSWPDGDPDGDGLSTERELELGTDPFSADTNGDGIDDLTAARSGIDPIDPDVDADGLPNRDEISRGTDPLRADSDDDGVPDGADCFPLDPARTACPEPTPGDTDPPVITLVEPTNAVLISTTP